MSEIDDRRGPAGGNHAHRPSLALLASAEAPVETDRTTEPEPSRVDDVERLLDEKGRDLGLARARVAVGRRGIAIGFPRDPMLHVSWWVLSGLVLVTGALLMRRRRAA